MRLWFRVQERLHHFLKLRVFRRIGFCHDQPHQTFKDARSKAQWAKGHIYNLINEYRALLDSDLTRLTIEDDFEPGQQRVKVVRITEFPPSIPLIIGDAVHNLQTAFDYIMVAITGMDWMALPVGRTRDDIISKSTHYRTIKETFPNLATFILEEIQPYQRGQFLLWELSELDRIDKHRLILPTINQAHRLGVGVEDQRGPGTPLKGEPVVETLDKFSELALQAIERFERFHFGRSDRVCYPPSPHGYDAT